MDNWVDADYTAYLEWHDENEAGAPLSLDLWLCEQTPEYRVAHAGDIATSDYRRLPGVDGG